MILTTQSQPGPAETPIQQLKITAVEPFLLHVPVRETPSPTVCTASPIGDLLGWCCGQTEDYVGMVTQARMPIWVPTC